MTSTETSTPQRPPWRGQAAFDARLRLGAGGVDDAARMPSKKLRRASTILIAPAAMIMFMAMATERLGTTATRVAMLVRMQIPVRDGLRHRVASEHASMNHYLEQLVRHDLDRPKAAAFLAVTVPKFAAKGKNGIGRPTRGARVAVMLRVDAELREHVRRRAASLHLTVNDYLESLVSQDISAANAHGEEMKLDQTA